MKRGKIWKIIDTALLVAAIIAIIGCTEKVYVPEYIEKEVYIPVTITVPEIDCEFTGGGAMTLEKMLKCLSDQKAALDLIRQSQPVPLTESPLYKKKNPLEYNK